MSAAELRVERARAVLAELGVAGAVRAAGEEGEIAAVVVAEDRFADTLVGEVAPELGRRLRALGFRYVTLDLAPAG